MKNLIFKIYTIVFVLLLVAVIFVPAQSSQKQMIPLSSVLDADGSIRSKNSGSYNPSGYRLMYGATGEPKFVAQRAIGVCAPDNWDTSFTTNGVNNDVEAIVTDNIGNIYIGGAFTTVQGAPFAGVAKWNGTSWSGFGTGVSGTVKSIAILGNDLYIGGDFASAGGVSARNVAKWNGSSWSAMSTGLGGGTHIVEAVAVLNGDVYAGGNFNTGDGSPTKDIARWNGTAWTSVGTITSSVKSLVVKDGSLYAGGGSWVGKWDGVSWTNFGPLSGTVNEIGFKGSELWAVGRVTITSGAAQVIKWNGTDWVKMAWFSINDSVNTLAFVDSDVYVAGTLRRENGQGIGNGVLKFDGADWTAIGSGTEGGGRRVNTLLTVGNTLYVGGNFATANGIGARNIVTLTNGTTWAGFSGSGLDAAADAIAVSGTDVYVGGRFSSAGSATVNRIAKWDSTTNTWTALGGGISGPNNENSTISSIAIAGGKVYAAGSFTSIGGIQASNIAVWNGTTWAALGTGVNAQVNVVKAVGDDIYVGGAFQSAGGTPANRMAKWNGNSWSSLNSGIIPNDVTSIAASGSDLYVGSRYTTLDGPNYILKYDGTTWTPLGTGMTNGGVDSIAVSGTDVYVSGGFSSVGGVPAIHIAKWDGSSWAALGSGLPGDNNIKLAMSGPNLIAAGSFSNSTGGPADHIARWNGSTWSALGNGLDGTATSVTTAGGDIFVGGNFTTAGCNLSPNFARWRETVWTGSTNSDWHTASNWGNSSIPPSNAGVTISAANVSITSADVTVDNLIIAGGRTLTIGAGRTLTVTGDLDLSNGDLAGPGILVVNGDLNINNGTSNGLGSVLINGTLLLNSGNIIGSGTVNVSSCRSSAIVGGSDMSFISSPLTRCVNSSGIYRFPVGTGSTYAPTDLENISGTANFTVEPRSGAYPAATGLPANRLKRWWQLTNGGITQADVSLYYSDADIVGSETRYRAFRIDGGTATQQPSSVDQAQNRVTVPGVTAFSPWTLAEIQPTLMTLNGRITTPSGRGADHVIVTLKDDQGNIRYAISNPFGYYRFLNVLTFKSYTLKVNSKKYTFAEPERTFEFDENSTGLNYISLDH